MDLTERQQSILKMVVEEYVLSAAPVPSEKIAGRPQLKVSSATVRNEMVELEDLGLLTHPHTSAGRMPSDVGYRYYIEHLMTERGLTRMEQEMVWHQFHQVEADLDEWLPLAAAVTAQMARTAALVTKLHSPRNYVRRVELVAVQDDVALVVLILRSGSLQQRLVRLASPISREELIRTANRLSEQLEDLDHAQVQKKIDSLEGLDHELGQVVVRLMEQSERPWGDSIYYEGIGFISGEPEFGRPARLMELVETLQRGAPLGPLLQDVLTSDDLRIVIGGENESEQMRGWSVVLQRFGVSDQATGVIGVVGPTRMRYWRAVSLVRFMAELLDRLVEQSLR
ncbi:MAG TPA: heat-inducible transcriptional repressor HrcA [Chloroflexota bacterium]|nr:heat-inducible transcriptional repressor HrcA [Chloroflexota bacterium]